MLFDIDPVPQVSTIIVNPDGTVVVTFAIVELCEDEDEDEDEDDEDEKTKPFTGTLDSEYEDGV